VRGFLVLVLSASAAFAQTALPTGVSAAAVQLDSAGNIYIAGSNQVNAVVAKLSPDGSQVLWQTVFAGSGTDHAQALALDSSNSVYVTGTVNSADFETTPGSLAPSGAGGQAFAAKLDASGRVIYSTYLPGTVSGAAITVDSRGDAFITGMTYGSGFVPSPGAVAGAVLNGGLFGFVIELDPAGTTTPVAISGFGGAAITLDPQGDIYSAGSLVAPNAPTTPGAFQSSAKALLCVQVGFGVGSLPCAFQHVSKIDSTGTRLIYATYLAGTLGATAMGLAVDADGNAIVAGYTNAPDYPTTPEAYQPAYVSNPDGQFEPPALELPPPAAGFVSKLNSTGTGLIWSTFLGGVAEASPNGTLASDSISSLAVDGAGNIVVSGVASSPSFPGLWNTPVPSRPSAARGLIFVARLSPDGTTLLPVQLLGVAAQSSIAVAANGSVIAAGTEIQTVTIPSLGHVYAIADPADGAKIESVAPGQLLTLYGLDLAPSTPAQPSGTFPASFNGVTVTFNGIAAPILYTAGDQINLQVPYEISGQAEATMQVQSQSAASPFSESYILAIAAQQPSIFLAAANFAGPLFASVSCGVGPIWAVSPLALNADGTLNSCANPAAANSVITVFLNGLGSPTPTQMTGAIAPTSVELSPSASIRQTQGAAAVLSTTTVAGAISSLVALQIQLSATPSYATLPIMVGVTLAREQNIIIWVTP